MAANDLGRALVISSVVMMCLDTSAVVMRLWVRFGILHGLGADDALIVFSWLFAMGICSATLAATYYGLGKHLDIVPVENHPTFAKLIMICSTSFSWGVEGAKASFAVLYLRILQGHKLAIVNKLLIAFLLCQAIEETMVVVFQCRPVARAWDSRLDGHCYSLVPMWWITFVFNLSTDLTLFIQPIPPMWKLQLPVAKRVGLIVMLSLGLLVCIISIIRIYNSTHIGTDSTYELAEPMVWSEVEITALILCSCIPSLRQVIQRVPWLNRLMGLSSAKDSRAYYGRSGSKQPGGGSVVLHSVGDQNDQFNKKIRGPLSRHQHHSYQFGTVSRVEHVEGHHGDNDIPLSNMEHNRTLSKGGSTDEILPPPREGDRNKTAGIVVTRDIKRDVEVQMDQRTMYTDTSSRDEDVAPTAAYCIEGGLKPVVPKPSLRE